MDRMKDDYLKSLFNLCASNLNSVLSSNNEYTEARKSAYDIEMKLRNECSNEQMKKIKTLLEKAESASLAESECLFEMAFNLGIRMVLNALK